MTRIETIAKLRASADAMKAQGATSLFLFGSSARDEGGPGSDLDVFIDYNPERKFSLLNLAAIKNLLEDLLAVEVDVTTRDSLHPMLRDDIEQAAIRVF
jgi:predicted nucleotidyltransferase